MRGICKESKTNVHTCTYINFVDLEFLILQAKFQDHRAFGSGEEDLLKLFLSYMGVAAILVM